MDKIIILMSTYNGGKYLEEQIDSILNQEGDFNLDIIVRDDGSSDNTVNILDDYQSKGKLTWYKGENLRPAKSFMTLLYNAPKADYYAFADQDDVWVSDKIKQALKTLSNEKSPALYFTNAELVDENLVSLNNNVFKKHPCITLYDLSCGACVMGCTSVYNNAIVDIIKKNSFPKFVTMHDIYMARVCLAVGGKIYYDEKSSIKYRQHINNVIGVKTGIKSKAKEKIKNIFIKDKISIADQAKIILNIYDEYISDKNKIWLRKISGYKNTIFSRLSLACSPKVKYISLAMSFVMRMKILFGNR